MPKRLTTGQGWPVGRPRSGCGAQGTGPSRFFFCDGPAPALGAAFFGYFLALLPKSDSPVGENPRSHLGKAGARPDNASKEHVVLLGFASLHPSLPR